MILDEIRPLRENHRLTIGDVAHMLHTSPAYVSRVERGLIMPSVKFLEDYIALFGLELTFKLSLSINQKFLSL